MATMEKVKIKQKKKKNKHESEKTAYENNILQEIIEPCEILSDTIAENKSDINIIENEGSEAVINEIENTVEDSLSVSQIVSTVIDECVDNQETSQIDTAIASAEVSEIIENPSQPVANVVIESKPSAPSYKELSSMVNKLKIDNCNQEMVKKIERTKAFTFEEIETVFGIKEIVAARQFAAVFEQYNLQTPISTHPLYEALMEYQRTRSQLILNEKDVRLLISECTDKQNDVWIIKKMRKTERDRCGDNIYLSESYDYIDASFKDKTYSDLVKNLRVLRTKATENNSIFSHSENLIKMQIDDLIWTSSVSGKSSIIDSLNIIFWVIRTSGWAFDKQLRFQLRVWCCYLAKSYISGDETLESVLFILHHLLRVPQGIRWGLHLIQCEVSGVHDIHKALCLLEVILTTTKDLQIQESKLNPATKVEAEMSRDIDDDTVLVVASEATDDSLWLLVDSDGEGADLQTVGTQNHNILRETDILGLLRQIPFEKIFKSLMGITADTDVQFHRRNLTGGSVLKVFAFVRLFLKTIRYGLILYKKYHELTKELCRLALHSVMYCTDLWEIMSSETEANLVERLSTEYNNVFIAGMTTLENAGSREISTMFVSEMPFKLCWDQTIFDFYTKINETLIISDSTWCHYTFITISNMAIARNNESFVSTAINNLFQIGYLSDFSDLGCGEWARTLCGTALSGAKHLIGPTLNNLTSNIDEQWLDCLPLCNWRPQSEELLYHLNKWNQIKINFIPRVLKLLNWECQGGIDLETQRSVAIFLSALAQKYNQPKTQPPEWIWECLLLLKLHCFDWGLHPSFAPHPESVQGVDISRKCLITNTTLILMTTWGHSVPLIYQETAPLLVKLANSGRFAEVTHVLYYVIPILSESPLFIAQSKAFKELLSIIFKNEKTYTKMASRLVNQNFPGPNIKLLVDMITYQLQHFIKFSFTTPSSLVAVWIHWLTSLDNWQSDWIVIYLLDVIVRNSFFHVDAMSDVSEILKKFIPISTSPKSTSTISWLWNNSSSHKGLVQCSMEAPFFWYLTLWIEHNVIEKETGVWEKLVEKLCLLKDKSKLNIDKVLKSVGGSDNFVLAIYRSLEYAISTPSSHPILPLLWQQFFYLYLNISFLSRNVYQPKPVGSLFFQDSVNSKLLVKGRARLLELKKYYESASISNAESDVQPSNEQQSLYNSNQAELMDTFYLWLSENFIYDANNPLIYSHPYSQKMNKLVAGENVMWMETINIHEYNKNVSILWPPSRNNLSNSQNNESKNVFSPNERILQRIQTYEKPIISTTEKFANVDINSLVDMTVINIFHEVYKLMETNLKNLRNCAKAYNNLFSNATTIHDSFCKLLPQLYERKSFCKKSTLRCADHCNGLYITLKGEESLIVNHVKSLIFSNRENYHKLLDVAMEPYKIAASFSAVIIRLSQLVSERAVGDMNGGGIKLFNLVLNSLNEEMVDFPPANSILNSVAKQLGERFVQRSGKQCINLINQIEKVHNEAFVCSLLRPLELSNDEMLEVYRVVSTKIIEMHIAFSCLSKFSISKWLRECKPNFADKTKFINIICEAIGFGGHDPPAERLILQELLCVHLDHMLASEFPLHLNQILSLFYGLTLDKKLPPNCWEHCFTIVEKYPDLITHQQACGNMESFGRLWWSKREMWGLHGLYDRYYTYISVMARFGALFTSVVLNTAMVHQPLLLTHQVCSIVFNMMCSFWNAWLIPRWDPNFVPSNDYTRSLSFMPWGTDDITSAEVILNAFVETLTYCIETLPGSASDFLRLSWQWYVCNFAHVTVPPFILSTVHKALVKLPWSTDSNHWITFLDLQSISKINSLPLSNCHSFIQTCLGNRKWQSWINQLPQPMQSNALFLLFPLLCRLQLDDQVLDDVLNLPWDILKPKQYEDMLNWFVVSFHTPTNPFFSNKMFPILCAAGGLNSNIPITSEWQTKQSRLIREWVSTLSVLSDSKMQADFKNLNKDISSSIVDLLNKIETTTLNAAGTDHQKLIECSMLLNSAIMMLNFPMLQNIAKQKWVDWIITAPKLCVAATINCVLNITQKDAFAFIAEHCLNSYFKHGGDWNYIINQWKNNCIIHTSYLIENNALLTAISTLLSQDVEKNDRDKLDYLDKHVIRTFHSFKPTSSNEKETALWIIYFLSCITRSASKELLPPLIAQIITILDKWSEKPSILQSIINQSSTPTDKFRIIAKYANSYFIKLQGHPVSNDDRKSVIILEGIMDQKSSGEVRHFIVELRNYIKNNENTLFSVMQKIVELSTCLYAGENFLIKSSDLFK